MTRALVLSAVFAMVLAGCIPVPLPSSVDTMDMPEASGRPLAPGEGVAILAGPGVDDEIPACLVKTMQEADPTLRIVEAGEVRNALFPWFERATTPDSAEKLAAVLRRPLVQETLASLNLGYVLTVTGGTRKVLSSSASGGVGGPPVMYGHWKKHSDLLASVWDVKSGSSPGTARISVSGSDTAVLVAVVGTWAFTMTERTACRELSHRLAAYLTGKQP